ncbi:UNVERIFIED_CONTAM: hypothetical protein HDU68_009179 [Siphonaria sp. JEL0065]|nr:hypothetical protein HDU68_009179 [Siphonaria sp. JEL0065]
MAAKHLANGKSSYYVSSAGSFDNSTTGPGYLDIVAIVTSIDVPGQVLKVTYEFQLTGDLLGKWKGAFQETKYDLAFANTIQKFTFASGSALLPQIGTVPIDGDFNQYPFDTYDSYFVLQGTFGKNQTALPIRLTLAGVPNGFNIEYLVAEGESDIPHTEVYGLSRISRSDSVKTFSMLTVLTMWGLGISAAIFTACLYLFDKKAEPPVVGFHIALLFAMPSVRNSMPVAPPIGALIDQMCLVWVMTILAICVLLQFFKLVWAMIVAERAAAEEARKNEAARLWNQPHFYFQSLIQEHPRLSRLGSCEAMSFLPRLKLVRFAIYAFICVIVIIASLTVIGTSAKRLAGKSNYYVSSPGVFDNSTTGFLDITATVTSIDVPGQVMKVAYEFQLIGGIFHETKYDLAFASTIQKFSFTSGSTLLPQIGTVPIDGDVNQYPFDTYDSYFVLQGSFAKNQTALPIRLTLSGVPNGFNIEYSVDEGGSDIPHTEVYGLANISRSDSVKSFSMLTALTMWGLGISAAIITACLYFFDKPAEPPLIGFHIALLFAMPTVRNSMPGAPEIGALLDQLCLVWVMMILAICVLLQFFKLVWAMIVAEKAAAEAANDKKNDDTTLEEPIPAPETSVAFLTSKI